MNYLNGFRNLEDKFLNKLKRMYPNTKVYILHKRHNSLTLLIRDMKEEFISEYELKEFDCIASCEHLSKIETYNVKNHAYLNHATIKRLYLKFMCKHFKDYLQDYKNSLNLASDVEFI